MNNDTTTHNTTRHYYMGAYSLGGHLWNAGEAYMEMAEKLADAGSLEFAGQFIRQAEEAYTWANALQAGTFVEVGEDMVGVQIDTLDAWLAPERVAILNARVRGESLPSSPSDVSRETYSPKNVSRETFVTPSPLAPAPSAYDEVMETYTPQQQPAKMNDVLVQLVNMIADVVVMRVTDKMEEMAEAVYDGKDIIDEVTESYQFGNALDSAISDYDISDKIREALQEVTFTVSVD